MRTNPSGEQSVFMTDGESHMPRSLVILAAMPLGPSNQVPNGGKMERPAVSSDGGEASLPLHPVALLLSGDCHLHRRLTSRSTLSSLALFTI